MAQRSKRQRKDLMQGVALAGSSSRSGPDDPRHRRGAQAEMAVEQRFDPDDFEVDSEQRVKVRRVVPPQIPAQAVCVAADALNNATSYTTLPLNAATTSVGTYITVDVGGDHISLLGGHVYLVSAAVRFRNNSTSVYRSGYVRIRSTGGLVYGERNVDLKEYHQIPITVTGVVDLSELVSSDGLDVDVQYYGETTDLDCGGGWITVQRIG